MKSAITRAIASSIFLLIFTSHATAESPLLIEHLYPMTHYSDSVEERSDFLIIEAEKHSEFKKETVSKNEVEISQDSLSDAAKRLQERYLRQQGKKAEIDSLLQK